MYTDDDNKEKYQLWGYLLIRYQFLRTNIMRFIGQTVMRITNEIESHAQDAVNLRLFTPFMCPCSGGNIMGIPSPIKSS